MHRRGKRVHSKGQAPRHQQDTKGENEEDGRARLRGTGSLRRPHEGCLAVLIARVRVGACGQPIGAHRSERSLGTASVRRRAPGWYIDRLITASMRLQSAQADEGPPEEHVASSKRARGIVLAELTALQERLGHGFATAGLVPALSSMVADLRRPAAAASASAVKPWEGSCASSVMVE